MAYIKYSPEEIERARNTDIIEFLKMYKGLDFKPSGHYYRCINKESDSLVIYSDRKGFVWNSQNISGGDTIDFLRKVDGKTFSEAVGTIIGENATVTYKPAPKYTSKPQQLVLPPKTNTKYSRVFAYLSQTRKISADVISDFMRADKLYQDKNGNCVFVDYDENKNAKFASIRGTLTEKKYRGDCKNSDKRYAFHQMGKDSSKLYVFEAPIDLMSHCTLTDLAYGQGAYKGQTRLALCGSSDVALEAFLERHKEVKSIHFRLDNDEAGRTAVAKFKAKYEAKGYEVKAVFAKSKDVNEDLINKVNITQNSKMRRR